ncbi:hypothetical protein VKT23_014525 [Stygiomarasmius scandens]|uniref:Uncharacterized protein n=1 Tax=Marasmiellus scandens TaxID=2682957 RepID=A0ABR1J070_9AGAR
MENTPALWTLLSISVVKSGQQLPDETLVAKWLSLSGVLPFEFVIDIEYDAKDGLKAPKSYLNVLLPYTDRLESIQLDFEFSYIKYFLDRPGLDLPNLKNVAIRFPWTELDDDTPLAALETAPSLQHLEYFSPDRDSTFLSRLVLPTSTITSLDITLGTDDPNVVRNIVVSCPKLEICEVEIPRYLDEVPDHVPVVLHHLETLSVIFSDPEGSPSFLDGLILPAMLFEKGQNYFPILRPIFHFFRSFKRDM